MDAGDFDPIRDAVRRLWREKAVPPEEQIEDDDRVPGGVRLTGALLSR